MSPMLLPVKRDRVNSMQSCRACMQSGMDGWVDGRTSGWADGCRVNEWMDDGTDRRME